MRAAGLARGGSLDNAVVISGDRVLNADGLRYARRVRAPQGARRDGRSLSRRRPDHRPFPRRALGPCAEPAAARSAVRRSRPRGATTTLGRAAAARCLARAAPRQRLSRRADRRASARPGLLYIRPRASIDADVPGSMRCVCCSLRRLSPSRCRLRSRPAARQEGRLCREAGRRPLQQRDGPARRRATTAKAAQDFDEVDRQHPYSVWATKAQLMAAYALYEDGKYDESIIAADRFIQLHPGHRDVAYAYYLKALDYYIQIADVGRDQKTTEQALKRAGRGGAPLSRYAIRPRRQAQDGLGPRPSRRQGDGDRPLVRERRASISPRSTASSASSTNTRRRPMCPRRWSGWPNATWRSA